MHLRNHVVSGKRTLLIDDNPNGLLLRKAILGEAGFEVMADGSLLSAMQILQQSPFDLIVVACCMPEVDIHDVVQGIRDTKGSIPIVVVSNFVESHGLTESSTGADAVLQKSASEAQHLVRTANRLIRRPIPRKPAASAKPRNLSQSVSARQK